MARYYFDIDDGSTVDLDLEGHEFSSVADVKATAARALVDLIERAGVENESGKLKVLVRDETGVIGQVGTAGVSNKFTEHGVLSRSKSSDMK